MFPFQPPVCPDYSTNLLIPSSTRHLLLARPRLAPYPEGGTQFSLNRDLFERALLPPIIAASPLNLNHSLPAKIIVFGQPQQWDPEQAA